MSALQTIHALSRRRFPTWHSLIHKKVTTYLPDAGIKMKNQT